MLDEVECATCNLKGSFAGACFKTARIRKKVSSRVVTVTARVRGRVTSVALCGEWTLVTRPSAAVSSLHVTVHCPHVHHT